MRFGAIGAAALWLAVAALLPPLGWSSTAPPPAAPLAPGEIVEAVAATLDPGQSYALYLPSAYTPETRWPVLYILDARGRGAMAAELFREGAERYGYILASSNNSRSDDAWEPNEVAINAMFRDTRGRLAIDPGRLYLAGFSGTARVAWAVAHALGGAVAGVIGASGGWSGGRPPDPELPFVYFGTAGTGDFNYGEMRELEQLLEELGTPHRFAYFEGDHSWPPPEIATLALAWLRLQAMRARKVGVDPRWVEQLLHQRLERAEALRAARPWEAWSELRRVVADFDGLADIAAVRVRVEELADLPEVAAWRAAEERLVRREAGYDRRLMEVAAELRVAEPPPPPARLISRLDIRALVQTAEADSQEARSARRMLALAFVRLSFYLPRELSEREEWRRVATSLEVAAAIRREDPRVWYNLAAAEARGGRRKRALDSLSRAVELGFADRGYLERDEDFRSLRGSAAFDRLVRSLAP